MLPYGSKQIQYSKTRIRNPRTALSSANSSFFESEEGQKEYEEWKAEQAALKVQTTDITA